MAQKGYRFGIKWIALNDEPTSLEVVDMAGLISVQLLSDLFEKSQEKVAKDVISYRKGELNWK